jgi:predicted dehydrogenase
MSRLSVAIVGAGNIAGGFDESSHARGDGVYTHAGAYCASDKFKLQAVFDVDSKRAIEFANYWGVVESLVSFEDVLTGFYDVISICSPDEKHLEHLTCILNAGCCKTIWIEKPVANSRKQIESLQNLASEKGINVVVNFQRRTEKVHQNLRARVITYPKQLLSVGAVYIKGLKHIGVTLIDTLIFICGFPSSVRALERVFNVQVQEFTYSFQLLYPDFSVFVRTVDSERFEYNYHIFELDLLFYDERITVCGNSQYVRTVPVGEYFYSGVRTLDEASSILQQTNYKVSMKDVADYLFDVTTGQLPHTINTLDDTWNIMLIIDAIIESFDAGCKKIELDEKIWKK